MNLRTILQTSLLVAVVTATGCSVKVSTGEHVDVDVNCVVTDPHKAVCTLKQTAGTTEVEACWDFSVACGNGNQITTPHTCGKVKDGGTAEVAITELTGADQCAGEGPKAKIANLTINGKAPTSK
jgi:hypothetical protein